MVVRRKRKINKLRGHRTCGHGNTKNRRGSGARGGVGRAGMHKHKFNKMWPELVKGHKKRLKPKEKPVVITIADLEAGIPKWEKKGLLQKQDSYLVIDGKKLGITKIIGTGTLNQKLLVQNIAITEKAAQKVKKAGGKVSGKESADFDGDDEFEVDDSASEDAESSSVAEDEY